MGRCTYRETGFCNDAACHRDGECKAHSTASGAHLKDDPDLAQFADLASAIGLREAHLPRWVRDAISTLRVDRTQNFDILMRPAGAWAEGHYQVKARALIAGLGADWSVAKTVGALKGLAWQLISQIEEVQMGLDLAAPGADRTVAMHHKPLLAKGGFYEGLVELLEREGLSMSEGTRREIAEEIGGFVTDMSHQYLKLLERLDALARGWGR